MHKRFLFSACLLSLLTLTSCFESKYPLTPVADAKLDERLIGVWSVVPSEAEREIGGAAYLHIGAEEKKPITPGLDKPEPGLMSFLCVEHGSSKKERSVLTIPYSGRFFVSKIDGVSYLNLFGPIEPKDPDEPPHKPAFLFMKYAVEGDRLTLWPPNPEPLFKAIKSGDLAGKVVRKRRLFELEEVELTATSEELTAFLKSEAGKKVFADQGEDGKVVFRRLR